MVLSKDDETSCIRAAGALRAGKLTVLPTDTIYGFSAVDSGEGARRIQAAKSREAGKDFIRLIAAPEDISRFSTEKINPRLLSLWPGAVTLVVPVAGGKTMAFRCPGDAWLRRVIRETGRPVFSTSVNRSGKPPLTSAAEIEKEFGSLVSLIISDDARMRGTGGAGALPSTLVDVSARPYRVLRQGAVQIPESLLNF